MEEHAYDEAEFILSRRRRRAMKTKQMEVKRRQVARQAKEREKISELANRHLMSEEDEVARFMREMELKQMRLIKETEERQRHDALLMEIVQIRKVAHGLGLPLSTPGLKGRERINAFSKRIQEYFQAKTRKLVAIDNIRNRKIKKIHTRKLFKEHTAKNDFARMEHVVAQKQHANLVRLIQQGASPNHEDSSFAYTPLLVALHCEKKHLLRELVQLGASVDHETQHGLTALIVAVIFGDLISVEILIELGADVDRETKTGLTPLLVAAERGRVEIAKYLLEKGASCEKRNKLGRTPLIQTSLSNQCAIARLLLRYNVNVFVRDRQKKTAVDYANAINFSNISNMMEGSLTRGKLKPKDPISYEEKREEKAFQLLHTSLNTMIDREDFSGIVRILRQRMISPNHEDSMGRTALMIICQSGNFEQARQLLSLGCSPSHQNSRGETSLMRACEKGLLDVILLLLECGASCGVIDIHGKDALYYASKNHPDIANFILKHKHGKQSPIVTLGNAVEEKAIPSHIDIVSILKDSTSWSTAAQECISEMERKNPTLNIADLPQMKRKLDDIKEIHQTMHAPSLSTIQDLNERLDIPKWTTTQEESEIEESKTKMWQDKQQGLRLRGRLADFQEEKMKILRIQNQGRRVGLSIHPDDTIMKYPTCEHCAGKLGRKRCHECRKIYCDKCYMHYHLIASRRHHAYDLVEPKPYLHGEELHEAMKKELDKGLSTHVNQAQSILEEIAHTLRRPDLLEPPKQFDPEIIKRRLQERIAIEKKEAEKLNNTNLLACKEAESQGKRFFSRPREQELGIFLTKQKRYVEAEKSFQAAFDVQKNGLGEDHPHVAETLREWGRLYRAQNRWNESVQKFQDALGIFEEKKPVDHRDCDLTFKELLETMRDGKLYRDSVRLCDQVLTRRKDHLDGKHPLVIEARSTKERCISDWEIALMYREDTVQQKQDDLLINGEYYEKELTGRLPEQFLELLRDDPNALLEFRKFVTLEQSAEALNFWLAVEAFQKIEVGTTQFREAARNIFSTYIKGKTLSFLTHDLKRRVQKILNSSNTRIKSDLYTKAQDLAFTRMHTTSYFRFVETEFGKRWFMDRILKKRRYNEIIMIQRFLKRRLFFWREREKAIKEVNKRRKERDKHLKEITKARNKEIRERKAKKQAEKEAKQKKEDATKKTKKKKKADTNAVDAKPVAEEQRMKDSSVKDASLNSMKIDDVLNLSLEDSVKIPKDASAEPKSHLTPIENASTEKKATDKMKSVKDGKEALGVVPTDSNNKLKKGISNARTNDIVPSISVAKDTSVSTTSTTTVFSKKK